MHSSGKRIAGNVLSLSLGELLAKALGFAGIVLIARVTGSETLGIIGFATAALGYFSLAVNPGLDTIGVRDIAGGNSHARSVSLIVAARLLLVLPVGLLFLLFVFTAGLGSTQQLVLLLFGISLLLVPFTLDFYFSGLERMNVVAIRKVLQALIYVAGIILLVSGPDDVVFIPVAFSAAILLSVLPQPFFIREKRLFSLGEITRDRLAALLKSALLVGGAQLLIMTYLQIDLVMCGLMLSNEQVGYYTAAQRIAAAVAILPWVLLQAYLPELARARTAEEKRLILRRFLRVMALPGIFLSAAGFILTDPLLLLVFGNSYLGAGDALRILFLNTGLVFLNIALANPLLAWKRDREYLSIVLGGALLNIILNAVLIPRYGITGAAWATLAAEVLVLLLALRVQFSLLRR